MKKVMIKFLSYFISTFLIVYEHHNFYEILLRSTQKCKPFPSLVATIFTFISAVPHTHISEVDQVSQTYRRKLSTIIRWHNWIDNTKTMKVPNNCLDSVYIYIICKQHPSIFHHCSCKQAKEMCITKTSLEINYINTILLSFSESRLIIIK